MIRSWEQELFNEVPVFTPLTPQVADVRFERRLRVMSPAWYLSTTSALLHPGAKARVPSGKSPSPWVVTHTFEPTGRSHAGRSVPEGTEALTASIPW